MRVINKKYLSYFCQVKAKATCLPIHRPLQIGKMHEYVNYFDWKTRLEQAIQNSKNKLSQFYKYMKNQFPNDEKKKKIIMAMMGFFVFAGFIYAIEKDYSQETDIDTILKYAQTGQIDTIWLSYIDKEDGNNYEESDNFQQSQDSNKLKSQFGAQQATGSFRQTDRSNIQKNQAKKKNKPNKIIKKAYCTIYGQKMFANIPNDTIFINSLQQIQANKKVKTKIIYEHTQVFTKKATRASSLLAAIIIPILIPMLLFRSGVGKMLQSNFFGKDFGAIRPNVKFNDVAGLGDSKVEVSEIVDFLKNPSKYKKMGAKIPKGALLIGPPGTGKTMLAKACAGQAGVPFYSISGSQFVQLYAGMGAYRVRDLFKTAKKQTPAIIFIDQIDAIGRKRQDKFGGANDQRANTLNQLLVQMDGFGTSEDIIVLAATNRKQMLDNALTRPGRFDRIIEVDLPDIKGRKQILQIYLNKIKLSPQQTMKEYAQRIATLTFGFSGADLANLCNQAAILAVRKQHQYVLPEDFQSASDRVLAGLEGAMKLDERQKKRVAYHESGHAVVSWFLQGASPLLKITIIPRSKGALGFAQYLPNQATLMTKQQLLDQLCVMLGGRMSQEFFFKQATNGASDDLQKVRQLVRSLIINYGMGTKFPNYAPVETDGQNIFSNTTGTQIDKQMITIIKQGTERTRNMIETYRQKVKNLAEEVFKKQTLNHKQIRAILGQRPFPVRENYKEFLEHLQKDQKSHLI